VFSALFIIVTKAFFSLCKCPPPLRTTLTRSVLSNIAFQYYPLDLDMQTNPFIVSWWPLALADPALFHVSLQTASLDEERRAQKGFPISAILMIDSVSLVRQRIQESSLAMQDETLDSVVTLAAIEVSLPFSATLPRPTLLIPRLVRKGGGNYQQNAYRGSEAAGWYTRRHW
jgi:hypothetical protein